MTSHELKPLPLSYGLGWQAEYWRCSIICRPAGAIGIFDDYCVVRICAPTEQAARFAALEWTQCLGFEPHHVDITGRGAVDGDTVWSAIAGLDALAEFFFAACWDEANEAEQRAVRGY